MLEYFDFSVSIEVTIDDFWLVVLGCVPHFGVLDRTDGCVWVLRPIVG
jgi:hypothetical protein